MNCRVCGRVLGGAGRCPSCGTAVSRKAVPTTPPTSRTSPNESNKKRSAFLGIGALIVLFGGFGAISQLTARPQTFTPHVVPTPVPVVLSTPVPSPTTTPAPVSKPVFDERKEQERQAEADRKFFAQKAARDKAEAAEYRKNQVTTDEWNGHLALLQATEVASHGDVHPSQYQIEQELLRAQQAEIDAENALESSDEDRVWVHGYRRANGTWVDGYWRRRPRR